MFWQVDAGSIHWHISCIVFWAIAEGQGTVSGKGKKENLLSRILTSRHEQHLEESSQSFQHPKAKWGNLQRMAGRVCALLCKYGAIVCHVISGRLTKRNTMPELIYQNGYKNGTAVLFLAQFKTSLGCFLCGKKTFEPSRAPLTISVSHWPCPKSSTVAHIW